MLTIALGRSVLLVPKLAFVGDEGEHGLVPAALVRWPRRAIRGPVVLDNEDNIASNLPSQ